MWLYTHLPRKVIDDASADAVADRAEEMLDRFAPGWRESRHRPLGAASRRPVCGRPEPRRRRRGWRHVPAVQQLIFRPVTGLGGPRTRLEGLYLGSAAIHPGGGVHGACGYLAARAALADHRWWGKPVKRL